jgi:chromosome segregation ATPase
MAIKKETILQFDAGTKSLKELRNELKELKKQLEDTTIGSQEYQDALQEIIERQTQLATITKSSVEDMEGSYNALNKKLAELRTQWKATNDESKRNELGSQMAEINDQLKDMDASVGNFQRNVGNYTSALDGLDDKLKVTGFSFDDAINRSNNWVEKGEHIEKTSIAMVASFAMINQTLSLMGDESEEARAVLEKLQIVMAMTAGFK